MGLRDVNMTQRLKRYQRRVNSIRPFIIIITAIITIIAACSSLA